MVVNRWLCKVSPSIDEPVTSCATVRHPGLAAQTRTCCAAACNQSVSQRHEAAHDLCGERVLIQDQLHLKALDFIAEELLLSGLIAGERVREQPLQVGPRATKRALVKQMPSQIMKCLEAPIATPLRSAVRGRS